MTELARIAAETKAIVAGLMKVLTTKQTAIATAALTAGWATFKAAFIKDHRIDFDLTMALVYMILMDTGLGLWKYNKNKKVSSKGFAAFFTKLLLYWCVIKVANWLALIPALGIAGNGIICAMMIRESISITENIEAIRPGTLPKWLVKRLQDFDDDGKINDTNTQEGDTQNARP